MSSLSNNQEPHNHSLNGGKCQCVASPVQRASDMKLWIDFAKKFVNHKPLIILDERLKYFTDFGKANFLGNFELSENESETLEKILVALVTESDKIRDKTKDENYKGIYSFNLGLKADEYGRVRIPRSMMDLVLSVSVPSPSKNIRLKLTLNGNSLLDSGKEEWKEEKSQFIFSKPLILPSLVYTSIELYISFNSDSSIISVDEKDNNWDRRVIVHGILFEDHDQRNELHISDKDHDLSFHPNLDEKYCYYRGIYLPFSARSYIF